MKPSRIQRDQVVLAALALLDQEGLEGLTLRKLAATLNVQAASLYWHFDDKQALIDAVADALIEPVGRSIPDGLPWDASVRHIARELRQALLRHRDGARVFAGTYVVTENVLQVSEAMFAGFVAAGATPELASTYAFSVVYYVLGFVLEEQALAPTSALDLDSRKKSFFELSKAKFPLNWAARQAIFSDDFEMRFSTGLDLLIAGAAFRLQRAKDKTP
eukprot:TRINITY_DN43426_c0_g1_i1.p1 TRINITY_DN43426_c0_g1~~TRINITY_DN43426_c0_g1_i1.p1  ORF type:complete len:218 (-),score=36.50 TRINITY_DN43426_c0_g1_i1:262-915(-)